MALNFLIERLSDLLSTSQVIGVTGSIGKTSTVLAIDTVLAHNFKAKVVELNLDSAKPKIHTLVITNVFDLQNEFPTHILLEQYANLASQLPATGALILNWDDPDCRQLATHTQAEVVFYGTDKQKCHVWAGNTHIFKNRVVFELNYGVERVELSTKFVSKHQIYSLLAATAVGLGSGLRLTQIKSSLEQISSLSHKLEVLSGYEGSIIIDDSEDGVIATTEAAAESLNNIAARRRIVVLGAMQEIGKNTEKLYRHIAQKLYKDKINVVILGKGEVEVVGDELLNLGFIPDRLKTGLNNHQIVGELLQVLSKGDVVLLKGARESRLDEVVSKIAKQ